MTNESSSNLPELAGAVLTGGQSRYYVSLSSARTLLSLGCILCKQSFNDFQIIDISYETSDLYVSGLQLPEVAGLRLALIHKSPPTSAVHGSAFIIDKKAAVCLKCFTEYLQQILTIKKGTTPDG